jgi:hypothetical protein
MYPYDEQQGIAFQQDVLAAYKEAGRAPDVANVVWSNRMTYDAHDIGYPASRAKHLAELRAALGLNPNRPVPVNHTPLPAFDQSDSFGDVHTTPPPELVIPTNYDPLFMRADFNGVTIDMNRWGSDIPILVGANTTPKNMLMSPMMIMYPRKWQDAHLTESAERNYSHYVFASQGWNFAQNNFNPTTTEIVDWAKYLKSWGFYATYWGSCATDDPFLIDLVNNRAIDFFIVGEEVDTKVTPAQLEVILDNNLSIIANGCPVAVHFTDNYPEGFPRDTYFDGRSMSGWDKYNGKVHLCWQANQNDSAGKQGAMLYYARQRVNLGLVSGNNQPAPDCRVIAYETMASAQLYGQCSEEYGCLRSLELLYCPVGMPGIRPVSGAGNGIRYPNGSCV